MMGKKCQRGIVEKRKCWGVLSNYPIKNFSAPSNPHVPIQLPYLDIIANLHREQTKTLALPACAFQDSDRR